MLRMPTMVPCEVKSNHLEDTLMSPAQPIDCVRRLPSQAMVNTGSAPPSVNSTVKTVAPPRLIRKFGRPPQKSPSPVRNSLPIA